jgi:ACR3 family arsenite efflux pump ArsB
LGFVALISAAASQGAVETINVNTLAGNSGISVPAGPTHTAGGWTIFLSVWVMFYQALANVSYDNIRQSL